MITLHIKVLFLNYYLMSKSIEYLPFKVYNNFIKIGFNLYYFKIYFILEIFWYFMELKILYLHI